MTDASAKIQHLGADPLPGSAGMGLPVAGTIIGRDLEIDQIARLLDNESVRVLSLLGPGGVGKTRLAHEVIRQADGDFAHGSAFVSLAPIRLSELVPFTVAQSLGVQERGEAPLDDALANWLRPRHMLLVLDNMEHLVDAAYPWLAGLVATCPRLKVLVTSRIPLNIAGEQQFRVSPLPVPGDDCSTQIDANAAVTLFIQRARSVRAAFSPDRDTLQTIANICTRLDGLPLAIELAAAQINALSPADILARLTDASVLLAGNRRDVSPRHHSLYDTIAWSYDLLSQDEQDLFRKLTLFVGGFSLEAAEAIGAESSNLSEDRSVAYLIGDLVDHSLVERLDGDGHSRYRMLETIREFGIVQLREREELAAAHELHAAYYQHLADVAHTGLRGPDQVTWSERIEVELGNLREAMSWLTTSGRIFDAVEMYTRIEHVLLNRAHFAECRRLLDAWLAIPQSGPRTRALALAASAKLALFLETPTSAIPSLLEEALDIFRELDDRHQIMETLDFLSFVYASTGDLERSRAAHEEHLALAKELGDIWSETHALVNLGIIVGLEGDPVRKRSVLEAGLAHARTAGDLCSIALALDLLGELALFDEKDPDRARTIIEESRKVREQLGDKRNLALTYLDLSVAYRANENVGQAQEYARKAVATAQDTGLLPHEGIARLELGRIALLQRDQSSARLELQQALDSFRGQEFAPEVAYGLDILAELALQTGDLEAAARFLGASDGLTSRSEFPRFTTWPANYRENVEKRVRTKLGGESFERCAAAARCWSLDDATTAALTFNPDLESSGSTRRSAMPHGLSPREIDVLRLMADGLTNREIADALFLSLRTVTTHITGILTKLNLSSRTQAVAYAIRNGLA